MFRVYICVILAFLPILASCHKSVRVRKTGEQPAPGKCNFFILGGVSRVHLYLCCNNCNEKHPTCDAKTYQSGSNGTYCNKCGVDNSKGNGDLVFKFSCGGCKRQSQIDKMCLEKVRKLHLDRPGFCWLYAFCFKLHCESTESEHSIYSNHTIPGSCFDLKCSTDETTKNCPVDCCGLVNTQCAVDINNADFVLPKCCTEPTCCI